MIQKRAFLLMFLFVVFLLPLGIAISDYNETGNYNSLYETSTGFWNDNLDSYTGRTRALTTPKHIPLVADLDGDNVNEIIVIDAGNIRLYQTKTLNIIDAYSIGDEELSNLIIYDIDGDSDLEMVYAETSTETLNIVSYNGTNFINETEHDLSGLIHSPNGDMMVKCRGVDDCILVYAERDSPGGVTLSANYFTSSSLGIATVLDTLGGTNYCFPHTRTMTAADYDNDATDEYIFTTGEFGGAELDIEIFYLNINSTPAPYIEMQISETRSDLTPSNACDKASSRQFTAPLVFDIDGSSGNGLETVIGLVTDTNEFKMYSYESDGSTLDDYPETLPADGLLISNVFRMNAFTDTGDVDFCVLGTNAANRIDLNCASEQTGEIPETNTFFWLEPPFNLTDDADHYNNVVHASQMSTETTEGNNLDEIITSWGVFELDYVGFNELIQIWESPQTDACLLPVDVEKVGREDILMLTDTNLWYYDDDFSFSPAEIDAYLINPCLDSTWKLNTSVEASITVIDVDSDAVSARAILYQGDSNEQDSGWSINSSSGATFVFSFEANKTIGTGSLRLMGRDDRQPTEIDTIDLSYSVGINGVEFNDCTTSVDVTTSLEEAAVTDGNVSTLGQLADELPSGSTDNFVTNMTSTFITTTGLPPLLAWIVLMLIANVIYFTSGVVVNTKGTGLTDNIILVNIGLNIFMLLIGILSGAIGFGTLLTVLVVGGIIVGLWAKKHFFSSGVGF